jgi:hypothetical protein
MARLTIRNGDIGPGEVTLNPGCNVIGREGENDILLPHPSVSRRHCEVWLTDEAVLVRDLNSRNGTLIDGIAVSEGEIRAGQTLRVGDIELFLADAPVRISVPELQRMTVKEQGYFDDGTPACFNHGELAAIYQCGKCQHCYCGKCVRELRVAGGVPRRFCPACGFQCERIVQDAAEEKRSGFFSKIMDALSRPPSRKR